MNELYTILLLIHIVSAIIGLGPGFYLIFVVKPAKNMTELRHSFLIRRKLHVATMIGGTLLLLSGLGMGAIRPSLFSEFWYTGSLILFLVALASGPLVLSPLSKPVRNILNTHTEDKIPSAYYQHSKRLFFVERIASVIFFLIIVLMILKPF